MKNAEAWRPTKYVLRAGRLRATRDQSYLAPTSRLAADLSAQAYGEALPAHAHGRLLDFGCGRVPLYGAYRSFIDVNICMDWMEPPGTSHVDVVSDLSREVPLPSSSTDTIIVSSVLEHLPDPARTWSEFERLLAPGGRVIGNVPFYYQLHEAPHDYFRFTEHALRRHIEAVASPSWSFARQAVHRRSSPISYRRRWRRFATCTGRHRPRIVSWRCSRSLVLAPGCQPEPPPGFPSATSSWPRSLRSRLRSLRDPTALD